MLPCLILAVALGNRGDVQPVERIEINHVYNQDGELKFTQAIVWEWQHDYRRFAVRGWRMVHQADIMRAGRQTIMRFGDKRISSRFTSETHTLHDPEYDDRRLTPMQNRNLIR